MTWTTEKPQRAGWYWWRANDKFTGTIVEVWETSGNVLVTGCADFIRRAESGHWAGPIEAPEEP